MSELETAPVEQPAPPEVVSGDAELEAIWDRANAESVKEDDAVVLQEPTDAAEQAVEAEAEVPPAELPENLPEALKGVLRGLPEDARKAVLADRDGLHRKLSDMGRQVQGIGPIRDVLVEAVNKMPAMADMRPEQVAQEVFRLAQISQGFKSKPVETMLGLIKQHNMGQAIQRALGGQPQDEAARQNVALQQHIQRLEQRLAQVADPNYLREQVTQITSQDRILGDVQSFAATAEHWDDLEGHIPLFIEAAKQKVGEGAAPGAVLDVAYNMALNAFKPEAQAPKQPVDDPLLAADPDKTKAALKAKSVNVTGKATGKPRVMTEDEELAAIWTRAQRA